MKFSAVFTTALVAAVAICAPSPKIKDVVTHNGVESNVSGGQILGVPSKANSAHWHAGEEVSFVFAFKNAKLASAFANKDELKVLLTRGISQTPLTVLDIGSIGARGIAYSANVALPSNVKTGKNNRIQIWRKSRLFGSWAYRTVVKSKKFTLFAASQYSKVEADNAKVPTSYVPENSDNAPIVSAVGRTDASDVPMVASENTENIADNSASGGQSQGIPHQLVPPTVSAAQNNPVSYNTLPKLNQYSGSSPFEKDQSVQDKTAFTENQQIDHKRGDSSGYDSSLGDAVSDQSAANIASSGISGTG